MSRESMLHKVRTALGRSAGQPVPPPPPPILRVREMDPEGRAASFIQKFEALAGKAVRVPDAGSAREWVASFLSGRTAVAANAPYLMDCRITSLPGVQSGFLDRDSLKAACSTANVGISSVDFALAETGSMVMIASATNPRLISLLPPVHVAVFPKSSIITGLDELFTAIPRPAGQASSMVFITGPSRTADIEQILVRGVHGPGEVYAVIVGD